MKYIFGLCPPSWHTTPQILESSSHKWLLLANELINVAGGAQELPMGAYHPKRQDWIRALRLSVSLPQL